MKSKEELLSKSFLYKNTLVKVVSIQSEDIVEVCEILNYGHKFFCHINELVLKTV